MDCKSDLHLNNITLITCKRFRSVITYLEQTTREFSLRENYFLARFCLMPRGDLMQDEISFCGYSSCSMHMYLPLLKKNVITCIRIVQGFSRFFSLCYTHLP